MRVIGKELTDFQKMNLPGSWERYPLFSPDFTFFDNSFVMNAIKTQDDIFVQGHQAQYCNGMNEKEAAARVVRAMNTGIETVIDIVEEHFPEERELLPFDKIPEDTSLLDLVTKAYNLVAGVKTDYKYEIVESTTDLNDLIEANTLLRALGLGEEILEIKHNSKVILSVSQFEQVKNWMIKQLGIGKPQEVQMGNYSFVRPTSIEGLSIYNSSETRPFDFRHKLNDSETGDVNYSSLMRKRICRGLSLGNVSDYLGTRFVVPTEEDADKLLNIFTRLNRGRPLENLKRVGWGEAAVQNKSSGKGLRMDKFVYDVTTIPPRSLANPIASFQLVSTPVEVMILTFEGDVAYRQDTSSDAHHDRYKTRQMTDLMCALFPPQLYSTEWAGRMRNELPLREREHATE